MSGAWPERLGVGDRVRYGGNAYAVTELRGRQLTLADAFGDVRHVDVVTLLFDTDFALLEQTPAAVEKNHTGLPKGASEQASWWLGHITEVLTGLPPDTPAGTRPRPAYDPSRHTLAEREAAKAEELTRAGVPGSSARSIRRRRQRYQAQGLAGLVDRRGTRGASVGTQWDPRVLQALQTVMTASSRKRSVEEIRRQVAKYLEGPVRAGDLVLPSRSTFHRLYAAAESAGLLGTPSIRAARTGSPDRWPGRRVLLDMVRLPAHLGSAQMLVALDEDSGSLLATVADPRLLHGPALLAHMCVPADQRARWPGARGQTLRRNRPVDSNGWGPVVRPTTLVIDRASVPGMRRLYEACLRYGIHVQQSTSSRPGERSRAEGMVSHLVRSFTRYAQSVAPALGSQTVEEVQELLDTWSLHVWPGTELPGLGAQGSGAARTPAGLYDSMVARAGWIATPLPPQEFTTFLPLTRRLVGPSGVRLLGRTYDSAALDALRHRRASPEGHRPSLVRWDPYDTRQIWLRMPDGLWTAVPASNHAAGDALSPPHGALPSKYHTSPYRPAATPSADAVNSGTFQVRRLAPSEPDIPEILPADVDRDRMAYHARLTVIAPDVAAAVARAEELVLLNEHTTGARHGLLLYGPAGTGKTTALTEIVRRHRIRLRRLPEPHRGVSPLVYVHVPPAATPRMFIVELVRGLGIPVRAGCSAPELAGLAGEALKDSPSALVLVDEAHNIRPASPAGASVREMLDYLCDRVPATFVYAGIGTTGSLASAVTAAAHRRLIPVPVHGVAEGEAWHAFISEVEQALRLREHTVGTLLQHADLLHRLTAGSVLRVSYLLRSAAIQAIRDGTERITEQALTTLSTPRSLHDPNSY